MQKRPLPGIDPFKSQDSFKGLDPLMSKTSSLRAQNVNTNFQVALSSQT